CGTPSPARPRDRPSRRELAHPGARCRIGRRALRHARPPTESDGCQFACLDSRVVDRHTDDGTVFSPTAVIVADVRIAEQLLQDEPGVRGALADAAVGDDRLGRGDALATVELP